MKNNDFLSDYEIKETIGKGTFSVVKLGINKATNEKVAIKILKKKKMQRAKDKSRLEREISILKRLNHINVIKIHKIAEELENYFIVMEYCENGELFNYIVARQRLSEEETAYFFYQLINGLDYIHHKNIVHRDLKPENLLLSQGNILKIVDFGLSNYYYPEGKLLSTPCGSPCYASPEMVCGNKYNGFRIDVWSCGIIIFAMICGYLPFEDPNNEILFKKIMKCKVDYPEYLSDDVLDIMNKIIVVDPNKRINIEQIKQHPFYLKGKSEFEKKHKDLVEQVEFDMNKIFNNDIEDYNNDIEDDIVFNINYNSNEYSNHTDLNIKKSKSSKLLKNENIDLNENKNDLYLFQIKKRLQKFKLEKNIIKKENINNSVKQKESINIKNNNKIKEAISKKFKINNDINKIISNKIKIKEEITNNSFKNKEKDIFEQITNKENIKSDIYNTNELTNFNTPLSDDFRIKNLESNNHDKKIFYSNSKNQVNMKLLNQLLNKEKLEKYFDEKKSLIPKTQKHKDSLSYILPLPQKKKSEIILSNKTEYKNKISNKSQKRLELIKYGISNKDINELFLYNNKNIQRLYEPNTTKNAGSFNNKNIHIKNLRILNNNNYNSNIENITNINNVKNINNIIIYNNPNSQIKSIIKDVQYLTNMNNTNNNNDLPNINSKTIKENKAIKSTKDIKRTKIIKSKNLYTKNNNVLIPKILLSKENSNTSITNNYNTPNLNKIYLNSINKKLNEIHKNLNKKNNQKIINKYKSSASSIDNISKNVINKKQISERTINSYGYSREQSDNHSLHKFNGSGGIYSVKNKNNLNKIKNYNIFNYKSNKDNMITLKKLNHTNK